MEAETTEVIAAIRRGEVVVIPTDTVYGLAADGLRRRPVEQLYRLKGRGSRQPTALVASSIEALIESVPELRGHAEAIARVLLPGPYTLIFPNPAHRLPWLTGTRPDAIGVRVPRLEGSVRAVLEAVGAVAATSANRPGGSDPRRLADVPSEFIEGGTAVLDGGDLPGIPSTVIDLTGPEPVVVREGAIAASEALALARSVSPRC